MESNQYLLANAYSAIGQAGLKRFLYLDFISCLGSLIDQGARSQEKVVSYLKRLLRSSLPAAIQAGAEAR